MTYEDTAQPAETVVDRTPLAGELTAEVAAQYIGMSVAFLKQRRHANEPPHFIRLGRTVRYRIADLDAWLSANRFPR